MISFVNAKINIGLYITGKRPDGYHTLSTCFYPVGLYNGLPQNPESFCDILEITPANEVAVSEADFTRGGVSYLFTGQVADCTPERNLVVRAAEAFMAYVNDNTAVDATEKLPLLIHLEKHLPFGAGLGGGSADATFTLRMLNELYDNALTQEQLETIAVRLGADCPVFVRNVPTMATGIGEVFSPVAMNLGGYWCAIIKPDVNISTAEAFRGVGIAPAPTEFEAVLASPVAQWRGRIHNAFEDTLFSLYPILGELKEYLYTCGAQYASMSGSGASIYGLFADRESALAAIAGAPDGCYTTVCQL